MKRNHATVWVPPRSVGERALASEALLWTARLTGSAKQTNIERNSLDSLTGLKSVNLVFDGRDVTLMPVQLPALPPAKLIKALPNIVEEMVLQDAASCAFALGPVLGDGRRLVAVMDKGWLEFVVGAFERRGLWVTAAWPAQLTLPLEPGTWSMLCINDGVTLRTSAQQGLGWSAAGDSTSRGEAVSTLLDMARADADLPTQLNVYTQDSDWAASLEQAANQLAQDTGHASGLAVRMSGLVASKTCPVELLEGRGSSAGQRWLGSIDWRAWRLPLALAASCLLAFLIGLNLHWLQMRQQHGALKASLERKFRQTFPNTPVVVDPVLQMQRQVATLRSRSGQSGPEDFGPLVAKLPAALGGRPDAVSGVEFREGRLRLRFAPTFVESRASRDNLAEAFRRQGLQLKFDGEGQATATVTVAG